MRASWLEWKAKQQQSQSAKVDPVVVPEKPPTKVEPVVSVKTAVTPLSPVASKPLPVSQGAPNVPSKTTPATTLPRASLSLKDYDSIRESQLEYFKKANVARENGNAPADLAYTLLAHYTATLAASLLPEGDERKTKLMANARELTARADALGRSLGSAARPLASGSSQASAGFDGMSIAKADVCKGMIKEEFRRGSSNCDLWFHTIAGLEKQKKALIEYIVDPIKFPGLQSERTKGILFFGPPGTGKTLLARAAVNELSDRMGKDFKVLFYAPTAADFKSSAFGGSEKMIKYTFECAAEAANEYGEGKAVSILFIDEVDSIAPVRGGEDRLASTTVNALLQAIDGFKSNTNVIVLAATNVPWALDDAFLERMDRKIYVPLPGREEVEELLHQRLTQMVRRSILDHALLVDDTPVYDQRHRRRTGEIDEGCERPSDEDLRAFDWRGERYQRYIPDLRPSDIDILAAWMTGEGEIEKGKKVKLSNRQIAKVFKEVQKEAMQAAKTSNLVVARPNPRDKEKGNLYFSINSLDENAWNTLDPSNFFVLQQREDFRITRLLVREGDAKKSYVNSSYYPIILPEDADAVAAFIHVAYPEGQTLMIQDKTVLNAVLELYSHLNLVVLAIGIPQRTGYNSWLTEYQGRLEKDKQTPGTTNTDNFAKESIANLRAFKTTAGTAHDFNIMLMEKIANSSVEDLLEASSEKFFTTEYAREAAISKLERVRLGHRMRSNLHLLFKYVIDIRSDLEDSGLKNSPVYQDAAQAVISGQFYSKLRERFPDLKTLRLLKDRSFVRRQEVYLKTVIPGVEPSSWFTGWLAGWWAGNVDPRGQRPGAEFQAAVDLFRKNRRDKIALPKMLADSATRLLVPTDSPNGWTMVEVANPNLQKHLKYKEWTTGKRGAFENDWYTVPQKSNTLLTTPQEAITIEEKADFEPPVYRATKTQRGHLYSEQISRHVVNWNLTFDAFKSAILSVGSALDSRALAKFEVYRKNDRTAALLRKENLPNTTNTERAELEALIKAELPTSQAEQQ